MAEEDASSPTGLAALLVDVGITAPGEGVELLGYKEHRL